MSEAKFTKGPWRWEINNINKSIELCGSGIEVLRFKRWGMSSATPTFTKQDEVFLLQGAHPSNLRVNIEGRDHHSDWCQTIDHPDAHLIAAAPDNYHANIGAMKLLESLGMQNSDEYQALLYATSKARGEQ